MLKLPFDPVKRAEEVENLVMRDQKRKYYRFRGARYYGGIATADMVGCCFLCAYCWNYERNMKPEECKEEFCSSEQVVRRLLDICKRRDFNKVRLSGAEPILGEKSFEHIIKIIEGVLSEKPTLDFILETNGFILGYRPNLAQRLSPFKRLFVRISVKGWDEQSFEKISGAEGGYFEFPLRALKYLLDAGVNAWPAIMLEIFGSKGIEELSRKLKGLGISTEELEIEYLEAYPFVLDNIKKRSVPIFKY
ncbi:MAG: radical SAM protein [Nitrospirota bacterium]